MPYPQFFLILHQVLAYAHDVNLLGDGVSVMSKNTQSFLQASREMGLEINADKTN